MGDSNEGSTSILHGVYAGSVRDHHASSNSKAAKGSKQGLRVYNFRSLRSAQVIVRGTGKSRHPRGRCHPGEHDAFPVCLGM